MAGRQFRASYQRAVRAANVVELFTAQGFNLFDLTTATPAAAGPGARPVPRMPQCLATGVPAA